MNRKQRKNKIKRATWHKVKCAWLKGGTPRKMKKRRGIFVSRGIRISRKKLTELSNRMMHAYMEKAKEINNSDFVDL